MKRIFALFFAIVLATSPAFAQSQRPGSKPTAKPTPTQSHQTPAPTQRPSSSVRPGSAAPTGSGSVSNKPTGHDFHSSAIDDKKRADARLAHQQATAPPASTFKTSSGHSVAIDADSYHTKTVRSLPRNEVVEHHSRVDVYHHQRYGARWDYYSSQPVVVVGHYSSPFWYSTYDWDAHRQAMWLYNNQFVIPSYLWQQRLAANIAVQTEVNRLAAQGLPRNPNYVDTEYSGNPEYMYSDNYVTNAYGTTVVAPPATVYVSGGHRVVWISLSSILGLVIIFFLVWLIFVRDVD